MKKLMFVVLAALSLATVSSYGQGYVLGGANAGASAVSAGAVGVMDIILVGSKSDCKRHSGAVKAVAIKMSNLNLGKKHIHYRGALLQPADGNAWFCAQLASNKVPKPDVFAGLILRKSKLMDDVDTDGLKWFNEARLDVVDLD
ncbi:MAG: hypothetical protein KAS93_02955 [Gammaproteobacteria bacterium]|nr:hypothetical protein [Gammaproteobacteria bacterium]